MIQSTSLPSAQHKLSDKSGTSKSDGQSSGSFIELLNELKNVKEPENNKDLISIISGLLGRMNEQNNQQADQDSHQEDGPQTRNDLIAFISTIFEKNVDPSNQPIVEKPVHNASNPQETNIIEKLPQLLKEVTAPKEVAPSVPFKPVFSEKFVERDFDFHRQFEGKEVLFQSITPTGNAHLTAKNDPSLTPKVSVEQFFSEVMGLLKNQTSIKKATEFIEAKFSLTPEKLGEIDVKVSIHKGQVVAHFSADTLLGKEALESQISLLKSSLSQQGFQVDKIEIALGGQSLQNSFSGQEEKSRQEQSQQRFSKKKINLEEFYQNHTAIEDLTRIGTENTINILA
ncbi:flagellar hook-length control protein FliK [Neobacillus drentensis]|uniref:flagellar hook-length control protein FliK n=1 Tax=Neobacillus drentensis TaxID=220684 RepID=UPI003002C9D2